MRAVVQRVSKGSVTVEKNVIGSINKGLVVLLGITEEDTDSDIDYMIDKIINLRIFEDENEKMNFSLLDINGEILVVSQFTLYGDCRKGRRPNFMSAAKPEKAELLYNKFVDNIKSKNINTQTGVFQADMQVQIENDGPVTLIIDSQKII